MKNIFLLPTDQPSRLVKDLNGVFSLMGELIEVGGPICNINIYITSDEEIKEGDWYLDTFNTQRIRANEFSDHKHYGNACKKIIFTTDFRLAPDVQKIDDEFLEWFVENPTCEYVEIVKNTTTPCECYYTKHCISTELSIKHHCREVQHNDYYTIVIPIIIPQEEPKQKAEKVTPMNDLLQDLKDTKLSIQDSIKEIKDGFIRNTVDLYIQKTLDVIILKIETELLEKEWKELEDAKLCEPLKSWDDEKPKQGPPTYDESIQHMLNAHKIPKELFGAKQEPKLCDGDLYFVGMVTDITEEYECLRCGQKYRYTAKNGSCNFFQLTKCTKGIPQEEPKPLDNLDERFKRDMSMIVMPLDNKNIPEEPLEEATETEIYLAINQIIAGGKDLIKGHVVSRGHAIDYAFDIALKSTKQQAERMYSEEEIRKAIQLARLCTLDNVTGEFVDLSGLTEVCTYGLEETHSEDSIIEQFKKK